MGSSSGSYFVKMAKRSLAELLTEAVSNYDRNKRSNNTEDRLSGLPQVYIDMIAKRLDPKSLVRLQLTCKKLFAKGLSAQRLLTCPVYIYYDGRSFKFYRSLLHRSFEQFEESNFRFKAVCMNIQTVRTTSEPLKSFMESLGGRGAVETLNTKGFIMPPDVDPVLFNQFLLGFEVSSLTVDRMSDEFFQLPAVKQLNSLEMRENVDFPPFIHYFLGTNIRSFNIQLDRDRLDPANSERMSVVLEEWVANKRVIEKIFIYGFILKEESLSSRWQIVESGVEEPPHRPFVIKYPRIIHYRVVRADGAVLSVKAGKIGQKEVVEFEQEARPYSAFDDGQAGEE